jgi:hypothetical protein
MAFDEEDLYQMPRKLLLLVSTAFVLLPAEAFADITVYMNTWEYLPQAQITQGRADDCARNQTVFGPARMLKGFTQTYPGTGSQGEDVCWRRAADPLFPNSGWSDWNRCSSDGDCEIR